MSQLSNLRQELDDFMARSPQSPLDEEQQRVFAGLNYYDAAEDFVFSGAVARFPDDDPMVEMQTSTGAVQHFRRWGRFEFEVDGENASVVIYTDLHGDELFLPFRDASNGDETYGAGRYLDSERPGLTPLSGDRIEVDFNYAYNPYCAYNENFSCPLPPRENWLRIPIRAGEKKFG